MNVEVNGLAVLLAALSSMVVGAVWYARPVFGNLWIKLAKIDMKKQQGMVEPMVTAFVMSLIMAYVLAHVTYLSYFFFGKSFMHAALATSFWVWLGFALTRTLTHDRFEGRPLHLSLLNSANTLVTLLVMGVIIGLMQP